MLKRVTFSLLLFSCVINAFAQNPSYQQKLYYTCKLWGFVKYYHSEVSTCQVNWDSVLLARLPAIKNCTTADEFNDHLDTLLQAAGPMSLSIIPFPDTLATELKRNRDWTWWNNDTLIRSDLKTILDTIRNNFRPHPICWVNDTSTSPGWLDFPYDDPCQNTNLNQNFSDEWNRLLILFKFWNIIRHFNPYNYVLDISWDSTLYSTVLSFANANTYTSFYLSFDRLVTQLNDAHAEGNSGSLEPPFITAFYSPMLVLKRIPFKYVVVKSGISSIRLGDEIVSVDGLSCGQWEDSLRPYLSVGDSSVFRRYVAKYMCLGQQNTPIQIIYKDSLGNNYTYNTIRQFHTGFSWFGDYFPNDTLAAVKWKKWSCNVGYINMGKLLTSDVYQMYAALQSTSTLIFDLRDNANSTMGLIADLIYPMKTHFSNIMVPDVQYPGTYYWYYDSLGNNGNNSAYQGNIVILLNEKTQSQGEFSCMILEQMSNCIKVGCQTAGADGNVSHFDISQDIPTGFSSLGIFYPNGDSTQRIGIVPDSLIYPTQIGIRNGRDELLEKALQIAGCGLSVNESEQHLNPALVLQPNPASDLVHLTFSNISYKEAVLNIVDLTGRAIVQFILKGKNNPTGMDIDVSHLPIGIYFLNLVCESGNFSAKMIKE